MTSPHVSQLQTKSNLSFHGIMVCSKSEPQQKHRRVWLGSKLLSDITECAFYTFEGLLKPNSMICKGWEPNK